MALLDIKIYPDEVLRQKTSPVEEFSSKLHRFLDDMADTMYDARGIGLAAPQVGLLYQVAVVDVSEEGDGLVEFINPKIISQSGSGPSEEGCLSIPEYRDSISRAERVVVEAQDRHGKPFQMDAEGLLAICLQHEIDHLHGVLFIDHLSRLKRDIFRRKWKKLLQESS